LNLSNLTISNNQDNTMDFQRYIQQRQHRIHDVLSRTLPDPSQVPTQLHQAMHYVTLNGGKRVRPLLVYASGESLGADLTQLDNPAAAVELVHVYSLVHDDLPAMDNDDLRRGKPTCHKAYDEATAILVGDALQNLAFQLLTSSNEGNSAERQLHMITALTHASGSLGMAGGQALDLNAVDKRIDAQQLETMHRMKTGALIKACIQLGAIAAQCSQPTILQTLDEFANHIGLAFQIRDDILDVEANTTTLGKPQGADQRLNKPTYPSVLGLAEAKKILLNLHQQATATLQKLPFNNELLQHLTDWITHRIK